LQKNIALIALVAISAFALLYTPVRGTLTEMVYAVAPHVWGTADAGSSVWNSFVTNFRDKNSLESENMTLHADVLRMQAQILDRNLLAEKVNNLEAMLGRVQSDNRVAANILAGPGLSPYDTLVVDAGNDQGVAIGNMVVYAGSGVIGEVVETTGASSKIKLYSSPGEEHLVTIGANSIPAKALGKGMGNFETKVPEGSGVALGDNVLSLKGGLILGVVSLIEEKPALPFARVFFRAPFNISEIRSVEIIIDKRP